MLAGQRRELVVEDSRRGNAVQDDDVDGTVREILGQGSGGVMPSLAPMRANFDSVRARPGRLPKPLRLDTARAGG